MHWTGPEIIGCAYLTRSNNYEIGFVLLMKSCLSIRIRQCHNDDKRCFISRSEFHQAGYNKEVGLGIQMMHNSQEAWYKYLLKTVTMAHVFSLPVGEITMKALENDHGR